MIIECCFLRCKSINNIYNKRWFSIVFFYSIIGVGEVYRYRGL